jgi:hypothetical protein
MASVKGKKQKAAKAPPRSVAVSADGALAAPTETWAEGLDPDSGYPFYTSSVSGEISWELPAGAVIAQSGVGNSGGGAEERSYDPETGEGFFEEAGEPWKRRQLQAFEEYMPEPVSSLVGDTGKRVVFPDAFPCSPLVRLSVVENLAPPRHRIQVSLQHYRPARTIGFGSSE